MSISLKNISDRVAALEKKFTSHEDTGWINGTRASDFQANYGGVRVNLFRYRVTNGICYIQITGINRSHDTILGTLPNWTYGELLFMGNGYGDNQGQWEGKSIKVLSDGRVQNMNEYSQWTVFPATFASCPLNK